MTKKTGQNSAAILTIDFYKTADKTDANKGLNPTARTVTISIKTKNDPEWLKQVSEGASAASKHHNSATVNGYKIEADASPVKKTITKKGPEKGEIEKLQNGLLRLKYDVILTGIKTAEDFSFVDSFDSEYLQLRKPSSYDHLSSEFTIGGNDFPWQWNFDDCYIQWEEINDGEIRFYANKIPLKEDGSSYAYYHITYYLDVKDQAALDKLEAQALANGGVYKLKNTAIFGDLESKYEVDYEVKTITKDGYFASGNAKERKYTFVIDANPKGYKLGSDGTVELTDQHTENLSVDYSSVKIYEIPSDVTIADAKKAVQDKTLNSDWIKSGTEVPWNFDGNDGTFTLADEKHYIITYDAVVIGSGPQNFKNVADLNGFISYKEETRDYGSSEDAGGIVWEIKLLKYKDKQTSIGLEGAKFQLFKGTGEYTLKTDDEGNSWYEEEKEPMKYGDTATTRSKGIVGENITFTTDSQGILNVSINQVKDGNEIEGGVHYFLKEVDSPAGYQIDSTTEYWAFTLTENPDEVNYGDPERRDEYGNRQWIYFYYNDILKVANAETTEPLDVVVNKHWFDRNGNPISEGALDESFVASVQLLRKTDNNEYVPVTVEIDSEGNTVVNEGSGPIELNIGNKWSYTWENLPRVKMGGDKNLEIIERYAYKIEEVNVDGYIVSTTETENETTKTYALNNYAIPDDKTTDLSIKKQWKDFTGEIISGTSESVPKEIKYKLYQVVSTTPFEKAPTSGGKLYVIPNDNRLVNKDAVEGDDDYGVYKLTQSDNWETVFDDLQETKNENGKTYFYAYYVIEIPIERYAISYTHEASALTITNREPRPKGDYIKIDLEKKWSDGKNPIPAPANASAVFKLHQQKSTVEYPEPSGPIKIVVNDKEVASCNPGDSISILYSGLPNSHDNIMIQKDQYNYDYVYVSANENGTGILERNVSDSYSLGVLEIKSQNNVFLIDSVKINTIPDPIYSNYKEVTSFEKTITLPNLNRWSYSFENLVVKDAEGNKYRYYITEDSCYPTSVSTVYKDDLGNGPQNAIDTDGKKVEVTNTFKDEKGSLSLTKLVKYKDNEPSSEQQYEYVDGSYRFKIVSGEGITPSVTKYVEIKVEDGQAKSYRIGDSEDALSDFVLGQKALISDLSPGNYIIEEVHKNGLMLTRLVRGDNDGSAIDEEKGTLTVRVIGGDKEALEPSASATFTNTYYEYDGPDKITLDVVKEFVGISSLNDVPDGADGFEVVLVYTDGGSEKTITLEKESDETIHDGIKIKASSDGLSISWHITNIPSEAKNFKIKEVRYNGIPGYRFVSASLDGKDITENAGEWHDMNVVAPKAGLDKVTNERHTPDSEYDLRYELQDSDILLSKLTSNLGTLVISKKSLNSIERDAVVKGWPQQGGFKTPGIYFSIEEHPEGFSYGNKSVVFEEVDGKTYVKFTSNAAAQEDVFVVTYDSHSELNNASLKNTYSSQTVSLDIVKVEKNNVNTKLPAAEFTIQQIKNTLGANGIEYIGDPITSGPTDASGKTIFEDISNGYYEIKETKLPRGYVITGDDSFYIKVDRGIIYLLEKDLSKNKLADWDSTKTKVGNVTFTAATETSAAIAQVENEPGTELPHTGGSGTALIKLIGIAVMLGAAAKVIEKRKQKNRRPEL